MADNGQRGGGGAGGGEQYSDSFTGSSSGGAGIAYMWASYMRPLYSTSKLKVKVSGTDYIVGNMQNVNSYGSYSYGYNASFGMRRPSGINVGDSNYRSYDLNPFTIYNDTTFMTGDYLEVPSMTGYQGVQQATSKIKHGDSNLKVLYFSDGSNPNTHYMTYSWDYGSYTSTTSLTMNCSYSGYLYYYYFILQAGGGGGGGADNKWGLFNYAAGGGGGGGGGACAFRVKVPSGTKYTATITVGGGGGGGTSRNGQADGGGGGGETRFKMTNSSGTTVLEIYVTGGSGGGGANGDTPGGGGAGGCYYCPTNSIGDNFKLLCICDGGSGGKVGNGNGCAYSSSWLSETTPAINPHTFSVDKHSDNSGGKVGSNNDRGGGGGNSLCGSPGFYNGYS